MTYSTYEKKQLIENRIQITYCILNLTLSQKFKLYEVYKLWKGIDSFIKNTRFFSA